MDAQFAQALSRYADVAVQVGVNLQPGQILIVQSDINAAPLAREIVRSAYQQGARFVELIWEDELSALARFEYAPRDSFGEFPTWRVQTMAELVSSGAARIRITSTNPDLLSGQDPKLISTVQQTAAKHSKPLFDLVTRGVSNWAIVAAPSSGWAARMFPDTPAEEREAKLWETIFSTCRINQEAPVEAWRAHIEDLHRRSAYLNAKQYSALHYTSPGTDLTIGLAENHYWMSGSMHDQKGIEFVANLPTEEVFTCPHRERVNGVVRSTKPLNLGGTLINGFSVTFSEGRVTAIEAEQGEEVLRQLIATDEGAARLGEVALVPERSPIAESGLVFYNTLFDENAASHIALGMAYRFTVNEGTTMDEATFTAAGGNNSSIHVDFMIGSGGIDIDGVNADGSREPVMRQGNWAF